MLLLLWRQNRRRYEGLGLWPLSLSIVAAGMLLIALRGQVPDWLSIIVSNLGIITGLVFIYAGLERFVGQRSPWLLHGMLLGLYMLIHAVFTYLYPSLAGRNINAAAAGIVVFCRCLWLIYRRATPALRHTAKWTTLVFAAYIVGNILRIAANLVAPPGNDFIHQANNFDGLLILGNQVISLALTFSLVLMINRRLFEEVEAQQAALRSSEARYRQLVELSPDGIVVYRDADSEITFANPALVKLMAAQSPNDLVGKPVLDFVHPDYHALARARAASAHTTGQAATLIQEKLMRLDGKPIDVEVTTAALEDKGERVLQTIVRDISERKLAIEQLRESQRQLEAQNLELRKLSLAIEQSGSIFVITDTSGAIQYANPRFESTTGYSVDEALGQNPRVLKSGEHSPEFYRQLWETITHGQIWRGEFHNQRKDGTLYWEAATITPVHNAAEEIVAYIAVKEDVTERKAAEAALRDSAERLAAQNAELDAFAHTVAHDLKSPLSGILGYAVLLEESYEDMPPATILQALRTITRSSEKLDAILEELLLLSGVRKAQVQPLPLAMGEIVAEVCRRLQPLVEEAEADLIVPASTAWPASLGHAPWVEEVWINYIGNALKYGGSPPRIELGCDPAPAPRFWVRDNGAGLTPEAQAKLFAPFTRLQQVRVQGYGLGLSIVRRIVEKLGGEVGVESVPGEGSAFWFTLPAAED